MEEEEAGEATLEAEVALEVDEARSLPLEAEGEELEVDSPEVQEEEGCRERPDSLRLRSRRSRRCSRPQSKSPTTPPPTSSGGPPC